MKKFGVVTSVIPNKNVGPLADFSWSSAKELNNIMTFVKWPEARAVACFAQLACQLATSIAGEDAPLLRFVLRGTPNGDDGKWQR